MALKIKIKKCGMVRKIEGVKKSGFYGKVIANGKKSFEEILKASCKNTTLDYREAELACKMMIDGIADSIKQGYIVDIYGSDNEKYGIGVKLGDYVINAG